MTAAVAFAAVAVSCVMTAQKDEDVLKRMSFKASYFYDDTKTVLVDRVKVYWQDGDEIAVSGAPEPFVTSLQDDSPDAEFSGEAEPSDVYYAAYPYEAVAEWADEVALLSLPSEQQAVAGTFAPGINISVASSPDADKSFFFRNVLGYAKLSIGSSSGKITSVTITSNAGEALSGDFLADCSSDDPQAVPENGIPSVRLVSDTVLEEGDYYIAMIPGTYEEGLTFTFEGPDGTAVKTINQELSLGRGKINAVGLAGLEWEKEECFYTEVKENPGDWSGEYLITYTDDVVYALADWDPYGQPACDSGGNFLDMSGYLTSQGIPAEYGDPYKAVVSKVGNSYSVYVANVGYIGFEGSKNALYKKDAAPAGTDTKYLWNFSYKDGGYVWISNAQTSSRRLQWNKSAPRFACYTGSQEDLTLYRKTGSSGSGSPQPDPDPTPDQDPDPTPDPDPDPTPEPDPTPDPGQGTTGKYGWYELPAINYSQSGNYLVDASDKNLYYAHHLCAGSEKGPGGKKARNYTVCYSAQHHCPVWVAAPRHAMYEGSANRTNAYAKDPDIPSGIQYSSKDTGGGCNKGHMLGSAERTSSSATNRQVFYYTNIAPQYTSTFNTGGGGWNTLEDWVDSKVCSDTLYVVIGTYFETYTDRRGYTDSPKTISFGGRDDVTRPSMFYYVMMRTKKGNTGKSLSECTSDEIMCAAFVRSHATPKGVSVGEKDMMSVSDLEKITGFTYFPNVPSAPKDVYKASDWGL